MVLQVLYPLSKNRQEKATMMVTISNKFHDFIKSYTNIMVLQGLHPLSTDRPEKTTMMVTNSNKFHIFPNSYDHNPFTP